MFQILTTHGSLSGGGNFFNVRAKPLWKNDTLICDLFALCNTNDARIHMHKAGSNG